MTARRSYPGRQTDGGIFVVDEPFWDELDRQNITPTGQWLHWLALRWCGKNATIDKLPEAALAQVADGIQEAWFAELVNAGIWHLEGADSGMPYYVLDLARHCRWYADVATFLRGDDR